MHPPLARRPCGRLDLRARLGALAARLAPGPDDLLRDAVYRRLWTSVLISSFGGQITLLALPLTAAVLLHASPVQMGVLTTMELVPFVLFALPAGVWLDRVRKLPVYIAGELTIAAIVASVPVAWWLGVLRMPWLDVVAFVIGTVQTTAGSASQIVLTQVVARERLVEAHAKNALASSGAEVVGPGVAGLLIKLLGAPVALLADAALLLLSATILRGIRVQETLATGGGAFLADLKAGLRFVRDQRLLVTLASCVGGFQLCHQAATVVNILFATRVLGLSASAVGLAYIGLGGGTVTASAFGHRLSRRFGPGPCLVGGFAACALGWALLACAPRGPLGVAMFVADLLLFGFGAILIFVNFIALRQAVTPAPMLGRMTSTMRWLILLPAGPGAMLGGWLGEHLGLRAALGFAALAGTVATAVAWRLPTLRAVRVLPVLPAAADPVADGEPGWITP